MSPDTPTVGASGAVFGIFGAGLVIERSTCTSSAAQRFLIVVNLVFAFTFGNISIGGHLGGLVGGALCMLALEHFGRQRPLLSREGAASIAALVAIGIVSVLIAYAKVRGLA